MNTAVINIKTQPETKKKAQEIAASFGLSLSALVNTYLKQVIRTKRINLHIGEEPSPYLISIMKKAEKNLKEGKGSPVFESGEKAVKWLEDQGI
jgi:addiction module RelB/DinJ family antitoxin